MSYPEQLSRHLSEPVDPGPTTEAHDFPLRSAPSQTSLPSALLFPQVEGFEHLDVSISHCGVQMSVPMEPAPTEVAHVAPPKSPPSHASAVSRLRLPHSAAAVHSEMSYPAQFAAHFMRPVEPLPTIFSQVMAALSWPSQTSWASRYPLPQVSGLVQAERS